MSTPWPTVICGLVAIAASGCSTGTSSTSGTTSSTSAISSSGATTSTATAATSSSGSTAGSTSSGSSTGGSTTASSTGASTGESPDAGCGCDAGYCDPLGSGRCLNCLTDAQCAAPKRRCQTSPSELNYGDCVDCLSTADCQPGQVCDPDIGATYRQCLTDCRIDAGNPPCPPVVGLPQHCVAATGTCFPGCALNVDCAVAGGLDGGLCDLDAGLCVQCFTPLECAFSQSGCSSYNQQCGGCARDSDCPSGQSCHIWTPPVYGFCVCQSDSQCGGNAPVCLAQPQISDGGLCGCRSTADCPSGTLCQLGFGCFPPCEDGGTDCSSISPVSYCDPQTGYCGPCKRDDQCQGNDAGFRCIPGMQQCGCDDSQDCPNDLVCLANSHSCIRSCLVDAGTNCSNSATNLCDPASGLCVYCLSDPDCDGGRCHVDLVAGNFCTQCLQPSDCPDSNPGCGYGYCGYCAEASDCPASLPLCYQSQCVASCLLSDGGTDCDAGLCQTSTGYCVQCLSDNDCQSQPANPFCASDVDAGNNCVQCRDSNDCPTSTPGCRSGFCGLCQTSDDCPASVPYCSFYFCGPSCVLPDGGQSCATGVCDADSGSCVSCLMDSDCQSPQPYCLADLDAGAPPTGGWAPHDVCVECLQNSQCAPGPCNGIYFSCGSCGLDSDCPAEEPHCTSPPFGYCTDGG